MLLLYIATGAFMIGGAVILIANYTAQKTTRKWY